MLDLIIQFPSVRVRNVPTADILPTMLTGIYPPEHSWDVSLKENPGNTYIERIVDQIPDFLTTTFQCFLHLATGSFDLATVPPNRRRMFEIYRTRYIKKNTNSLLRFGKYDSILNIIGKENSVYLSNTKMYKLTNIIETITEGNFSLKMFETYSLDLIEHWNLDNPDIVDEAYRQLDYIVAELYEKCLKTGVTFILFSDHGQDRVNGVIELKSALEGLNLSSNDYIYYIEAFRARFWFNNDVARQQITNLLNSFENASVFSYEQMNQFNFDYRDDRYGELFFVVDPGFIIFPHDFYHPLANIFLGLMDVKQRSRIYNPVHRGNHHYLPTNDSEKGLLVLADDRFIATGKDMQIGDFAPTILSLLDLNIPKYMKGSYRFH